MVHCNPESTSSDYYTSEHFYFEAIILADVLEIVRIEKLKGVIIQYGGQPPLKLEAAGISVIGQF